MKPISIKNLLLGLLLPLLMTGCVTNISLLPEVSALREQRISGEGSDKIAVISVAGFISEEKSSGLVQMPDMVSRIKEELQLAAKDDKVKAVLLRINSPGGTVSASDLIHHEIMQFKKKTGKKVIASILDLGASGAYYIAMAADKVTAHPTSVVGSIGVIMMHVNFEGLMEKVGVGAESIKSGDLKDMGTPIRPLAPAAKDVLQGIIDDMYGRFLLVIGENRKNLSAQKIKTLADGRVYTATQALDSGLVDQIAYLDEVIELTEAAAGMSESQVVVYQRRGAYKNNIYSKALGVPTNPFSLWGLDPKSPFQGKTSQFLYLWTP